ncbi:MAG: class I SAM-dependent methyltransferase [Proteobacteria bacterium]|nr:class I SAM-dependent methyltransferase [Pseudomonadota bacterium]
MDPYIAANRANWDERVGIHVRNSTGFYGIDRLKAGGDTLHAIELAELGPVAGKRLLHLQCHFGLDTLSFARRGVIATGLDFSSTAIAAARALSLVTGLVADFVEANVYDAPAAAGAEFDLVFTSWGTICWLDDIRRWAAAAARCLAPGGVLYLADMHPAARLFEERDRRLVLSYDWQTPPERPLAFDDATTYNGDPTPLAATRTYEWQHPLSSIVDAVLGAGLRLTMLNEHEVLPWHAFPMMVPVGDGIFGLPPGHPRMPLAFSLKAVKT